MHKQVQRWVFLFIFISASFFLQAQIETATGSLKLNAFQKHQSLTKASPYKNLSWRNTGPDNISGRVTEIAGISGKRNIMYAAFATGGFWKTTDAGENWVPLFDEQATQSIGSFALAPSNNEIIYLGTGEGNIFRASLPGLGMYKTLNGGKTWQHIGLENTGTISRIVIDPNNADIVYAAASGNEWSYNIDRGVYKSENGGKTWKKVLENDEKTGAIDLVMDPADPNTLIASTWNRIRQRWSDPVPEDGDHRWREKLAGV
jgi:photosystem II stability/assembly factor-like uncharacterized protein